MGNTVIILRKAIATNLERVTKVKQMVDSVSARFLPCAPINVPIYHLRWQRSLT